MENDELFEKLYDIFTENYKDKINKNKDLQDYLQEKTKNELVGEYLFYETAANGGNKEIEELKKERKDKIIKLIMDFLDDNFNKILEFFNEERFNELKYMAD